MSADPQTPCEWQEAADLAELCVVLDSAGKYGFVTGVPDVDVDRCEEIIARAAAMGITPAPAEQTLREMADRQLGADGTIGP